MAVERCHPVVVELRKMDSCMTDRHQSSAEPAMQWVSQKVVGKNRR